MNTAIRKRRASLVLLAPPCLVTVTSVISIISVISVISIGLQSCTPPPPPPAPFQDLVLSDQLGSSMKLKSPQKRACADQTHFSLTLRPGEQLTAAVEIPAQAQLLVSGCAIKTHLQKVGTLEVAIEDEDGKVRFTETIAIPGQRAGWWQQQVDLAALAGTSGRLRLSAELAKGARLLLRDLMLSNQVEPRHAKRQHQAEVGPQILLISIDTLRADAIAAFGGRWSTPNLDAFAERAQSWTNHYAADTWTKPSHAALLTGHYSEVHRCFSATSPINPTVQTLAERLQTAGLATEALVSGPGWLDPKFGFDRGFDRYREVPWQARHTVPEACNWIAEHRDQGFFYFLHLFEVHSDFTRLPYEGPEVTQGTIEERFGAANYGCRENACASGLLLAIKDAKISPLATEDEILSYTYGAGVSYLDQQIGVLLSTLDRLALTDDLLIIITSDHGESLLEHERAVTHGMLWQEVIQVPLMIKWPHQRYAGSREHRLVSALDVAPTLLAFAGLPYSGLPGHDLLADPVETPVVVGSGRRALVFQDEKAIYGGVESAQLYDLAVDPKEQHNLAAANPERMLTAQKLLNHHHSTYHALFLRMQEAWQEQAAEVELSEAEKEHLRALGYTVD